MNEDEKAVKGRYPKAHNTWSDGGVRSGTGDATWLGKDWADARKRIDTESNAYEPAARSRLEPVEAATLPEKMSDEDFVKQKYPDASQWAFGTYHDGEPFYRVYDTPHVKTSSNLLGHGWAEAARIIREIEPVEAVSTTPKCQHVGPGDYCEICDTTWPPKVSTPLPQQALGEHDGSNNFYAENYSNFKGWGPTTKQKAPALPQQEVAPCKGDPNGTGFCENHECEEDCQIALPQHCEHNKNVGGWCWKCSPNSPNPPALPQQEEPAYFVETGGDGACTQIVPESRLRQEIHELMCMCGLNWKECGSAGVTETVALLDDDSEWESEGSIKHWSWGQDFEDGHIRVTYLMPNPAPIAPLLGQDHEIIYQRSLKATQELLSFLDISYQRGRKYANRLEVTIAICIEQNMKGIHR